MSTSPLVASLDIPRFLAAVETETAAFVRAVLQAPALASARKPGAGARPCFHGLACELVIVHGGGDAEHAGELHVHVAGSRAELRDVSVEEWALARAEARAGVAQPPFTVETRRLVTGYHAMDAAARGALTGEPYPLEQILDAVGRGLLRLGADDTLSRSGFVARPVLSAFTLEELEWMEGAYTVPTERMARLRRKK